MKSYLIIAGISCLSLACSAAGGAPESEVARGDLSTAESARLSAHWTISDAFTAEEQEAAVASLDAWSAVTGGLVSPTSSVGPVAPGDPLTVRPVDSVPGEPGRAGETEGDALDKVAVAVGEMARRHGADGTYMDWFRATVAHELGHALMESREHSQDPGCVMQADGRGPVAAGITAPTACDAAMLAAAWASRP